MVSFSLVWTVQLIILATGSLCQKLKQQPVIQPTTNLFVGQRDFFTVDAEGKPTRDNRIVNYYTPGRFKLNSKEFAIASLGLSNWGPIQTSLLMTKFPDGYENYANEPFCAISDELINYKLRASLNLPGLDKIVDLTIFEDQIFILSGNLTLLKLTILPEFGQKSDDTEYHPESSSMVISWSINMATTLQAKYNLKSLEGGMAYDPQSKNLYIVSSDLPEIVIIDSGSQKVSYSKPGFITPKDTVLYVAVKQQILYIGQTTSGIKLLSISDPLSPKLLHTFDSKHFGQTNSAFKLFSFDVDDYQLEILNTADKAGNNSQQMGTDPGALFRNDFTLQAKLDFIQKQDFRFPSLLVLTESGIYTRSLPILDAAGGISTADKFVRVAQLDGSQTPTMITRFNNWVYVLSQVSSGSVITEILMTDTNQGQVNKVWRVPSPLTKIYVDDKYLYTVSPQTNILFERGIGGEWTNPSLDIGKVYSHSEVLGVSKAIINGYDFLIVFTGTSVLDYMVQVSDPHIRCPPRSQKEFSHVFGTFEFSLNATVRNCPMKIRQQGVMGPQNFGTNPCLLQFTFDLEYSRSPFYQERNYLFGTVGAVLLVVCVLFLCVCCYRRRLKKTNSENEVLRKEIMMFKEKSGGVQANNPGGIFMPAGLVSPNKYKLNKSSDSFSEDRKSSGREKVPQKWDYAQSKASVKTLETDGI